MLRQRSYVFDGRRDSYYRKGLGRGLGVRRDVPEVSVVGRVVDERKQKLQTDVYMQKATARRRRIAGIREKDGVRIIWGHRLQAASIMQMIENEANSLDEDVIIID